MAIEVSRQEGLVVAKLAIEPRLDLQMDHFAVAFQVARVVRFVVTLIAMESLQSLMNAFDMIVEEMLVDRLVVALVARKCLRYFMDGVNMSLHVALVSELFAALFTIILGQIVLFQAGGLSQVSRRRRRS